MSAADYTAILLAAGQGTRIAGTTAEPKVLLDLYGRSLLERHFEAWEAAGIKSAVLVVGFEQRLIRDAVTAIDTSLEITLVDNLEFASKGNTHSMWLGLEASPAGAVVFDADLVYEPGILQRCMTGPSSAILVGAASLDDIECTKALVDEAGHVRMTIDKREVTTAELERYQFAGEAMGVLKFDAVMREKLAAAAAAFLAKTSNSMLNWEHLLNEFLMREDVTCHFDPSDQWVEIDTPEDYTLARQKFAREGKGS